MWRWFGFGSLPGSRCDGLIMLQGRSWDGLVLFLGRCEDGLVFVLGRCEDGLVFVLGRRCNGFIILQGRSWDGLVLFLGRCRPGLVLIPWEAYGLILLTGHNQKVAWFYCDKDCPVWISWETLVWFGSPGRGDMLVTYLGRRNQTLSKFSNANCNVMMLMIILQ